MRILFYRGPKEDHDPELLDTSDESTHEYDASPVAHMDYDGDHFFTIYTTDGHWYFILTDDELEIIVAKYLELE